jgi:hypothetical protein
VGVAPEGVGEGGVDHEYVESFHRGSLYQVFCK